jgi:hypothetical protein
VLLDTDNLRSRLRAGVVDVGISHGWRLTQSG